MIGALARKLFGSSNDRRVKGYQPRVDAIYSAPAFREFFESIVVRHGFVSRRAPDSSRA